MTVLVLQLASGQFSPRVLRTFLRDQRNQVTLGVFLATFLLALIVLRAVRGEEGQADQFVTGASIAVSFVLVASVGLFVQCIHNIANSIRVIEIIDRIATETDEAIDRVHPEEETSPPALQTSAATRTVAPDRRRVVTGVNLARLASVAERACLVLVVIPRPGAFVAHGMPMVAVHGDGDIDQHQVRDAVILDKERDLAEDPAFGFRQLVDIAEPALSPGTNDPTTAAQCLDHLNDLAAWRADHCCHTSQPVRTAPYGQLRPNRGGRTT